MIPVANAMLPVNGKKSPVLLPPAAVAAVAAAVVAAAAAPDLLEAYICLRMRVMDILSVLFIQTIVPEM